MTEVNPQAKTVLVCQNRTCLKQGSAQVLQAFRSHDLPEATEIREVKCLGQCGSGPMVLVLPEESWYSRLDPAEVDRIVTQHLRSGHPVRDLLYPKFHPQPPQRSSGQTFPAICMSVGTTTGVIAILIVILQNLS